MNILDRVVGYFAPERGLKRVAARARTEMLVRAYNGAKPTRHSGGWMSPATSANGEIKGFQVGLRNNSREMGRNNPYGKRTFDVLVGNVVGPGILPRATGTSEPINKKIDAAYRKWSDSTDCDADGQLNMLGLMTLAYRAVAESGEVFIRLRYRRPEDGLEIPLQLQVLEGDHCPINKSGTLSDGNSIIQGIEFDKIGKRVAYWMYRTHPGDGFAGDPVRIPAAEILHVYRKNRPGQLRGVPELATSMESLQNLFELDHATVIRAKIEACLAGFVTSPEAGDSAASLAPTETDEDGERIESFEPGLIQYLKPGEDMKFLSMTSSGGYDGFSRRLLQGAAVGSGITYDQISGDLTGANFSSLRAGKIEFRRMVEQIQYGMLIPMLCQPIWNAFVGIGYVSGLWNVRTCAVEWTPPRHEPIDPKTELEADIIAVRSGLMTLHEAIARQGYDPKDVLAKAADINAEIDRLGLILDSDPRKTQKSGGVQMSAPAPID